jgi:hypothetical protein
MDKSVEGFLPDCLTGVDEKAATHHARHLRTPHGAAHTLDSSHDLQAIRYCWCTTPAIPLHILRHRRSVLAFVSTENSSFSLSKCYQGGG